MGLSSKKTTQKTDQTQTQNLTRTPTNPPFVTSALQNYTNRVRNTFTGRGPDSIRLDPNQLQNYASNAIMNMGPSSAIGTAQDFAASAGSAQPMYSQGAIRSIGGNAPLGRYEGLSAYGSAQPDPTANIGNSLLSEEGLSSTAQPASVLDQNIDEYMNPYIGNVQEAALQDFDSYAGRIRAQQAASAARNGTFGSRYAIREAETEGQLSRARNSINAGLLSQGFDRAMGYAEADTGRRQQAGLANQQASLYYSGLGENARQFDAGLGENSRQFNAGLGENARQFDAGLWQNNNQFNSQLHAGALDRQLAAAGLLGNLGATEQENLRANIAMANNIGNQRYAIDYNNKIAPYNFVSLYGDLLAKGQYPLFQGQQQSGTVNTTGQTTTRQGNSLLDIGLGVGSMFL